MTRWQALVQLFHALNQILIQDQPVSLCCFDDAVQHRPSIRSFWCVCEDAVPAANDHGLDYAFRSVAIGG